MKQLLLFLLIVVSGKTFSQTRVAGMVTDFRNEPVPGANIIIEGTYDGTSSDAGGRFSFETEETGEHRLTIRFVGYVPYNQPIVLDGTEVILNIRLEEAVNELHAVTITAGSFTAGDAAGRTVFKAVDIATTAGATADIAGALNTLPGTQKVGESGRLFVRGGESNETRTFIDGMMVLDAYGPAAPNTPSRGRYLPFMFKGMSFSTGGYSAEYGQALSSALVLDSKDESAITRTDIGLLSVGGDITQTNAWDRGSVAAKLQYTNIRPYFNLVNQDIDWKAPPMSIEGITAFRQRTGENGIIKFYGNFSRTSFSLYRDDMDDQNTRTLYDLDNGYSYLNGSYKGVLNQNWNVRGGVSYSAIRNDTRIATDHHTERDKGLHAKAALEGSLSPGIENKTGIEVIHRRFGEVYHIRDDGSWLERGFDERIASVFTESDVYLSNRFVTRAGGRLEYNSLTSHTGVDPRISLAYKPGKSGQVSVSYGRFRQTAQTEYVRMKNDLKSEKAEHLMLNYQRTGNNRTFRLEAFYKRYRDLVKFGDPGPVTNDGTGYARGLDFFWRDNRSVRGLDYWISYSLLDSKRDYLDFPREAVPVFVSTHNVSVVGKYFVTKLKSQLGTTFSYSSGRPYNDPNEASFNASRTPSYQDISFNWSYLPRPHLILYFSCTNLLGRNNIFGYEYSARSGDNGVYHRRAIRQPAPRFIFLAVFLTLSKEKSLNLLPSL